MRGWRSSWAVMARPSLTRRATKPLGNVSSERTAESRRRDAVYRSSNGRIAAIDHQMSRRDVRRIIRRQKQDGFGDFGGVGDAFEHTGPAPARISVGSPSVESLF